MTFSITTGVFAVILLLLYVLAIFCGHESAKERLKKDEISAANFATMERILIGLLCVTFLGFILIGFQDSVTTGFVNVLRNLGGLKNG